jgi:hypothetical protein
MPYYRLPNGMMAHINMGRRKNDKAPPPCPFFVTVNGQRQRCMQVATLLCDFPTGIGQTCSAAMCDAHALALGEEYDLCPTHNAQRGLLSRLLTGPKAAAPWPFRESYHSETPA